MSTRTTMALAVVAAVLILLAVATRRAERSHEQIKTGAIFPDARVEDVAGIEIIAQQDTVRMFRQAGHWFVATEGGHPADTAAVRGLLDKLEAFDRRYLKSNNPAMQATFEVDEGSGDQARLLNEAGKALADFRLGKNGPDFRSQYIRPAGSSEVFLIPEYLRASFDAHRVTWRDRSIFAFDPLRAQRLFIQTEKGEAVEIVKTPAGDYVFATPDSLPAKKNVVEATLRALATLRADAFPDSALTAAEVGLAPPRQRIEVALEDGGRHELMIGRETSGSRVYVAKSGDETIFLLGKNRVGSLVRDPATLREQPPAEPPAGASSPAGTP